MKKHKRSILWNMNRQQEKVLLPFYVACVVAVVCVFILALNNNPIFKESTNLLERLKEPLTSAQTGQVILLVLTVLLFFALVYWAILISNKILGAHDRIVRELDEVILGKGRGPIKARNKDDFFNDLLMRINILIETNPDARVAKIRKLIKKKSKGRR